MNRRTFLAASALGLAGAGQGRAAAPAALPEPTAARLPLWRGFNLLERFGYGPALPFVETDFAWMAEWGFNYARLPMSYKTWIVDDDWRHIDDNALKEVDRAVALGERYGVHICINFHRAPGYCIGAPAEPVDLWKSEEAQEVCALHWRHFAARYRGIPNARLSFNLINEPPNFLPRGVYRAVAGRLVEAIRAEDPARLILADGAMVARAPEPELIELGVAQCFRGYDPMRLTHYRASWVHGADTWPEPAWPFGEAAALWDKARLDQNVFAAWREFEKKGVGVMAGEWGAFNQTPHAVVLAWMRDCLEIWREAGWGWALWNLRGPFGVIDSERGDVAYETFQGHKLDRAMLDLLRA